MENKYQLVFLRDTQALDARSKAPKDVETLLSRLGYQACYQSLYFDKASYQRLPRLLLDLACWLGWLPQGASVLLQYPVTTVYYQLRPLVRLKGLQTTALIHDLESYRHEGKLSSQEVAHLQSFDRLIVHTPAMQELLVEAGIQREKTEILGFFDYLVEEVPTRSLTNQSARPSICFAGNLSKSTFLRELPHLHRQTLTFLLYGVGLPEGLADGEHIQYRGAFQPDDISGLEGDWGLVWDGDSLTTCSGRMGQYLRINSPHKASLYLAKGIPLIVWEQSALAPLVKQLGVGISVSSLEDLPLALQALTSEDKEAMTGAVSELQHRLCQGEALTQLLK